MFSEVCFVCSGCRATIPVSYGSKDSWYLHACLLAIVSRHSYFSGWWIRTKRIKTSCVILKVHCRENGIFVILCSFYIFKKGWYIYIGWQYVQLGALLIRMAIYLAKCERIKHTKKGNSEWRDLMKNRKGHSKAHEDRNHRAEIHWGQNWTLCSVSQ